MLVGRTAELSCLDRLLAGVLAGCGDRAIVVGDPGIGKTALLAAVERRARARGIDVLHACAAEGTRTIAFSLLDDLERACDMAPSAGDAASRGDQLLRELVRRAGIGPVVLVVDDAHFADEPSLDAVAQAAERAGSVRVAVIVATRPEPDAPARFAAWPRLDLGPLGADASVALLRAAVGADHPAPLPTVAEAFGGIPLALVEAPRLLTPQQLCGREALPLTMPVAPSLARAWSPRLDSLSEGGRRALVDVAVAGTRRDVLAAMAARAGWTDADLDELMRSGLVTQDPQGGPPLLRGVVRDVVLERSSGEEVRDAHRRAADASIELALPPRVVIDHLVRSVITADADVAAALQRQAERAEEADLLAMASDAWRESARLSVTLAEREERALRAVRLVILNGLDYAGTDALIELLAGADLDEESRIWLDWLRALQRSETDPDSALDAQWSTIGRAKVSTPQTVRMLLWDTAMNAWTLGNAAEGLRAAHEYRELERRLGTVEGGVDPPWTGTALVSAGLFQSGRVAESVPLREQAIAAAAAVDPSQVTFDQLLSMVFLDDLLLDMGGAASSRVQVALQRMVDESAPLACLYGIQAWRARARGDWAVARDILAVGRPLAVTTGATGPQLGMSALAVELAGLGGDEDDLREESARLREVATRQRDRRRLATLDRALGLRALAEGRLDAAISFLCAAADNAFLGRGLRDGVLPARVDVVEALVRAGDPESALRRSDEVRTHLAAMTDPAAQALAFRVVALTANGPEADHLYVAAQEAHARATDPFEQARTLLLHGEHLRRTRHRADSRAVLLQAERLFDQLGARPWLARTRTELRASGGQPDAVDGLAVLTAQERAVALAVADGRTNREAAEMLFLSPKTVEYHLGSVYRKLGVHGRGALARRMLDEQGQGQASRT